MLPPPGAVHTMPSCTHRADPNEPQGRGQELQSGKKLRAHLQPNLACFLFFLLKARVGRKYFRDVSLPSVSNSEQKFPFTQTNFAEIGQPVPSRGSAPRGPHRGLPDHGGGSRARSPPLPTLRGRPYRGGDGAGRRDRSGPSRPERRTNGGGGRGRGGAGPGRAGAGLRGAAGAGPGRC